MSCLNSHILKRNRDFTCELFFLWFNICLGARTSNTSWQVWNFNVDLDELNTTYPFCHMTRFHRVRSLHLRERNGQHFIHCSCGFYNRVGIPCPHFFYVFPHIEIEMFHVRSWKVYSAHYGKNTKLGKYLVQAQEQYFLNEKNGIPVPSRIIQLSGVTQNSSSSNVYPILCGDTSEDAFLEAQFVKSMACCTHDDLFHKR